MSDPGRPPDGGRGAARRAGPGAGAGRPGRPGVALLDLGIALAAAGAVACGGDGGGGDAGGGEGATVRDSAGVEVVESMAPAWEEGEGWTVAPEPELRLGTATGGGPEQFGDVGDVALLSDGRIAVTDRDAQEIRVFAPDGSHVATLGGEGGGPGEFSQIASLAVGPGDTLFAGELEGGTVSVFGPDGAFVREVRPDGGDSGFGRQLRGVFADGSFVVSPGITPGSSDGGSSGIRRDTQPEFRIGRDGSVLDTLGPFPGREESGGGGGLQTLLFGRSTHFAVAGNRFYAGDDARWKIRVFDPSGRLVRVVRKPHEPVPVRPEDLERRREDRVSNMEEALKGMPVPADQREEMLDRLRDSPARETLPAFDGLFATSDGHLWVQEARRPGEEPRRWSVFDPEGRWLGTVETPTGLEVRGVTDDRLVGVREDDLGVQRVEVYRVRRP